MCAGGRLVARAAVWNVNRRRVIGPWHGASVKEVASSPPLELSQIDSDDQRCGGKTCNKAERKTSGRGRGGTGGEGREGLGWSKSGGRGEWRGGGPCYGWQRLGRAASSREWGGGERQQAGGTGKGQVSSGEGEGTDID